MSDALTTARLALPLLAAGQAQKEITHNEALTLLDAALAPVVEGGMRDVPPVAPVVGQCWLVGASASGAWAGQSAALACWTSGGWRFVTLPQGASVVERVSGKRWLRAASSWFAAQLSTAPAGGAVIDAEARAAIAVLVTVLGNFGLVVAA